MSSTDAAGGRWSWERCAVVLMVLIALGVAGAWGWAWADGQATRRAIEAERAHVSQQAGQLAAVRRQVDHIHAMQRQTGGDLDAAVRAMIGGSGAEPPEAAEAGVAAMVDRLESHGAEFGLADMDIHLGERQRRGRYHTVRMVVTFAGPSDVVLGSVEQLETWRPVVQLERVRLNATDTAPDDAADPLVVSAELSLRAVVGFAQEEAGR